MRRVASVIAVTVGFVLVAGSGITRWVVAPDRAVLPGDTDTTRQYAGTAATLFDQTALSSDSGAPVLLHGVPITVTHRTRAMRTDGDSAMVSDAKTVRAGGKAVAAVDYRYAVDRTDMARGSGYPGVIKQTGLTFNWPIRTQAHDYLGWVADTRHTTSLHYAGRAERGGISTDVFTTTTAAAPITDPQVLGSMPRSLPKATLVPLAATIGLPLSQLGALAALLPSLPDPVPLAYTYRVTATYWVAPDSGIVVDLRQREVRALALVVAGRSVPVTSVMDMSFTSTPATLTAAVKDARDKGDAVSMIYDTAPLTMLIAGGALLLLGGAALALDRRRPRRRPGGGDAAPGPFPVVTPIPVGAGS